MFLLGLLGFFIIYCLGFYRYFFTNRKNWDTFTRCMSMFNALQCVYMVWQSNTSNILSFYYEPSNYSTNSLYVFSAYLFIDGLFQIPDLYTDFTTGLLLSLLHHLVGGIGIYSIANIRKVFFLGYYFAMTEISTPMLNLSWYFRYKFLFYIFYLLFTLSRIVTIPILLYYIENNKEFVIFLEPIHKLMYFYASYTLILLNFIWFCFITKKLM